MGLTPEYADDISFVELLDVPTTGRTDRKRFWDLFSFEHAETLDRLFLEGSRRLVVISRAVVELLHLTHQRHGLFSWADRDVKFGVFHEESETRFMKAKHFSAAMSSEELAMLRNQIVEFCDSS